MSTARIEKLNTLLSRVRERRAEARLMPIPGANALPSANTNVAPKAQAPRSAPPELSIARDAPVEARRPTSSIHPAVAEPEVAERTEPPLQLKTPTSTVPPPSVPAEPMERAPEAAPAAAPQRIAPSPALPFDAAVKVVSSPRIEAPKTFGELLEQSLALRPK